MIESFAYLDCKAFFGMDLYLHGALQCLVQCPNTEDVIIKQVRAIAPKSYMHKEHRSHLSYYIPTSVIN